MTTAEHAEFVCRQINKFRSSLTLCDALLVTEDREFPVHRTVLAATSRVFRETFSRNTEPLARVHIVGVDSSVVEIALDAIYLGEIRLPAAYVDSESLTLLFKHLKDLGIDDDHLSRCMVIVTDEETKKKQEAVGDSTEVDVSMDVLSGVLDSKDVENPCDTDAGVLDEIKSIEMPSQQLMQNLEILGEIRVVCKEGQIKCESVESPVKSAIGWEIAENLIDNSITKTVENCIKSETATESSEYSGITKTVENCNKCEPATENPELTADQVIPNSIKYITITKPIPARSSKVGVELGRADNEKDVNEGRSEYVTRPLKAYVCNVCSKAFSQPNHLLVHMRVHTGEQPYVCTICAAQFSQHSNLKRHELLHTGRRPHFCGLCGRSFIQKTTLQEHMVLHGQGKPRPQTCARCGEKCASRKALYRHVTEKHRQLRRARDGATLVRSGVTKPFICGECGRAYAARGSLQLHRRRHESELEECGKCGKKYVSVALLRQHIATHTREKRHICATCGKAFLYSTALSVHKRLHTGERPYRCQECEKQFAQYGHLQSHMRTHTGEKPFKCDVCDKAYKQRNDLKLHRKRSVKCSGGVKDSTVAISESLNQ